MKKNDIADTIMSQKQTLYVTDEAVFLIGVMIVVVGIILV
jgi:hypothetical protein